MIAEYHGRVLYIADAAESRAEFERRLLAFKGFGPVTLRIFMREAQPVLFPK
ncbi:hypothetical protein [Rhodanobacter sp. L36]|uniref:hypothetical protein n=1 Tax=Rhodanobacter sp. L36 TaxID=1747221 RepID=UPI0020B1140F|nr:hypothetical protein [Rhodanobacter sp. L36]